MFSAGCRGEVVLAAGTVGSPLVLMRSGIGPERHLREIGVEVVLDLPGVGQNLQDHPAATVVYRSAQPIPPAANNHGELLGLLKSDLALDAPDLQILFVDVPLTVPPLPGPDQGYALLVSLMAPHSRGSVQLQSAEPQTGPRLDPNYLSDPRDIDALVAGLDLARAIGRANGPGSVAQCRGPPGTRRPQPRRPARVSARSSADVPPPSRDVPDRRGPHGRGRHRATRTRN